MTGPSKAVFRNGSYAQNPDSACRNPDVASRAFCLPPVISGDTIAQQECFVGDNENRLVRVVAESLLANQGGFDLNPIVLCGHSGVGKTLLVHCLVQQWKSIHQNTVIQFTGADWARSYVNAVHRDEISVWRENARNAALFVLDDVPQLLRQPTAQRELCLLLNDRQLNESPTILTLPENPAECEGLDRNLASRLDGGLVLKLHPPGMEARQRIIERIMHLFSRKMSVEARDWFAEQFSGNVPSLQNALFGCLSSSEKASRKIGKNGKNDNHRDPADSCIEKSELKRLYSQWIASQQVSLKSISESVSRYCQVSLKDMKSPSRRHSYVQARSLAMYLAKRLSGKSLRVIGQHFGGRDHTTVLHACQKIETAQDSDPTIQLAVQELTQILREAQ